MSKKVEKHYQDTTDPQCSVFQFGLYTQLVLTNFHTWWIQCFPRFLTGWLELRNSVQEPSVILLQLPVLKHGRSYKFSQSTTRISTHSALPFQNNNTIEVIQVIPAWIHSLLTKYWGTSDDTEAFSSSVRNTLKGSHHNEASTVFAAVVACAAVAIANAGRIKIWKP